MHDSLPQATVGLKTAPLKITKGNQNYVALSNHHRLIPNIASFIAVSIFGVGVQMNSLS